MNLETRKLEVASHAKEWELWLSSHETPNQLMFQEDQENTKSIPTPVTAGALYPPLFLHCSSAEHQGYLTISLEPKH